MPMAVYGDRLNLLVRNGAHWSVEEQLAGTQAPTHVGRMLKSLAIGYIAARSPQGRGRVERLWATLQDRLVSELRLREIRTVAAAQTYLPEFIADFNRRFGKPPADRQPVWRRSYRSSRTATARIQPPVPPTILIGKPMYVKRRPTSS